MSKLFSKTLIVFFTGLIISDTLAQEGFSSLVGARKNLFNSPVRSIDLNDSIAVQPPDFQEPRLFVDIRYARSLYNKLLVTTDLQVSKNIPALAVWKDRFGQSISYSSTRFTHWVVGIPVELQLRLNRHLYVSAGPMAEFHFIQKDKAGARFLKDNFPEAYDIHVAGQEAKRKLNWYFNYGLTLQYKRFLFDFQHGVALQTLFRDFDINEDSVYIPLKVNSLAFTTGYMIFNPHN